MDDEIVVAAVDAIDVFAQTHIEFEMLDYVAIVLQGFVARGLAARQTRGRSPISRRSGVVKKTMFIG